MGMGLTTTSTQVSITGGVQLGIAVPITAQTPFTDYVQSNADTPVTIFTPTAGKTRYVKSITVNNNRASSSVITFLDTDGTSTLVIIGLSANETVTHLCTGLRYVGASQPFKLKVTAGATTTANVTVSSVEE